MSPPNRLSLDWGRCILFRFRKHQLSLRNAHGFGMVFGSSMPFLDFLVLLDPARPLSISGQGQDGAEAVRGPSAGVAFGGGRSFSIA